MRRLVGGSLCVGALLASGVLAAPATAGDTKCESYKATGTSSFTKVNVVGSPVQWLTGS